MALNKRSDRQNEIADVAAKLFRQKGFAAVSMRDLAAAMEIKAASLYNHISSKQDVLALVIMDLAASFTQGMELIYNDNAAVSDKLSRIIALHIDLTIQNPNAMASLNNDWMHLAPEELKTFIEQRDDYEDSLRRIIRQGISENNLFALNEDVVVFSLLSTLRTLYLWYGKRSRLSPEELKNDLVQALLLGLVKQV
jgi:AcrR family transcriptional regulator